MTTDAGPALRLDLGGASAPLRSSAPPEAPPPHRLLGGPEALLCGVGGGGGRAPSDYGGARARGPRAGLLGPARATKEKESVLPEAGRDPGNTQVLLGASVTRKKLSALQNCSPLWEKREGAKPDEGCRGTRQGKAA